MPASKDLVRLLAHEAMGRAVEDQVIEQTAKRLDMLLLRLRSLDEADLQALEPAAAFDGSNAAWAQQPTVGPRAWTGLGRATTGSSGYGGPLPAGADAPLPAAAAPQKLGFSPPGEKLADHTLTELAELIRSRQVSAVEATQAALARLEALQPHLNAFITVTADQALAQAKEADALLSRGETLGPLHGAPVAFKDIIKTNGVRTTAGSRVLAGYVPDHDATVVRRLTAAGAIMVGKTHTHEFAFGATSNNACFGPARNPWGLNHSPGGSSGGSGAAVAAGIVPCALGTDTGGSIRIPAACCGIVGLKATYGRVSKYGVFPLSWSLDHVGPLTRTVADAALALQVLAGPDVLDPTTAGVPLPDFVAAAARGPEGLHGLRVGLLAPWLHDRVDAEVQAAVTAAAQLLAELGATLVEVADFPSADDTMLVNRILALGEAASYHAPHLQHNAQAYGDDVRGRLELGLYLLARDYLLGQRLRGEMCRHAAQIMARVDVLVAPTLPTAAPLVGQELLHWADGPETVPDALIRLTAGFSVTGQPAISLTCGYTGAGLPIGLQIVGRLFDEATLLRVAAAYEAAAPWRRRSPFAGATEQ